MSKHPYVSPPMGHQLSGLKRAWRKSEFAYFWEMGTGKTFTIVNLAAARHKAGLINALIVICPTPIKLVWESEFEQWCPYDYDLAVVASGANGKKDAIRLMESDTEALKVLVVGVEALSQGTAHEFVLGFVKRHTVMTVADESSKLKNASSARTKNAIKIAAESRFRVILTGTPVTQGIEDLYAQFLFLNPRILNCRSYFVFRNKYCLMGGFEGKQIVGYQNTGELLQYISPYVDVVKKEDVLDLPDKVYERIVVEPTAEQLRLIDSLKDSFVAEYDGDQLITETILERLTRFQQIIGGNFPYEHDIEVLSSGQPKRIYKTKPIKGKNPKMEALLDLIRDLDHEVKVIIWCRFVPEAEQIADALVKEYGEDSVAEFKQGSDETKKRAVHKFREGPARFMVSKPHIGGMGQTWIEATFVVYYSNSFSYEDRVQSEDRCHRKGQTNKVTYVDIEANHKYDRMILKAIRNKASVAQYVDENIESLQQQMEFTK